MRFGFVGPSYTSRSSQLADEEAINWFPETLESQGSIVPSKSYGGQTAGTVRNFYGTPGLVVFATCAQSPVRGSCTINGRCFFVAGTQFVEVSSAGAVTVLGTVASDGLAASLSVSSIQVLIVSGARAYCFVLATNVLTDVTSMLAGVPVRSSYSDGYFVSIFRAAINSRFLRFLMERHGRASR